VKVAALAGGVGGAKLLVGLSRALGGADDELAAIVNIGDDAVIYGVHVSPDVDIVTYWLAGIADFDRGWGIAGDTFNVVEALAELGRETWFRLGDRDFATCLFRTERMRGGASLSAVTDEIRRALGVEARVLPATDDTVRTNVITTDGRTLEFQEYFVKERFEPEVTEVLFAGAADAKPAPGILDTIASADTVVVCPSNPVVSVGPMLALPGIRDALRVHPKVVAVTPIVRGRALKGPADRLLASTVGDSSASAVARMYADFLDTFVVDATDAEETERVSDLGVNAVTRDTLMTDHGRAEALARSLLEL
jgi:LPPG:FO 2-phospho-L-lactate transferase